MFKENFSVIFEGLWIPSNLVKIEKYLSDTSSIKMNALYEKIININILMDDGIYDHSISPDLQKEILEEINLNFDVNFVNACLPLLILMEEITLLEQLHKTLKIDMTSTLLLNLAIFKQNIRLVELMLKTVYKVEDMHMYEAIATKNITIVQMISDYLFISDDIFYYNALHGTVEIAQYFMNMGCNITMLSLKTCIEYTDRLFMFKFLIDKTQYDHVALYELLRFAIVDCNLDAAKYLLLLIGTIDEICLFAAASNGNDDLGIFMYINEFFSVKYCVNCQTNGITCLTCTNYKSDSLVKASEAGNVNIIDFLVNTENIDVDCQNGLPLVSAAYANLDSTVKFLIECGANTKMDNSYALNIACRENNLETVRILLEHKANPDTIDGQALIRACYTGNLNIVQLLVEYGANINLLQNKAVIVAVTYKHFEIVDYLLTKGGSIHIIPGMTSTTIEAIKLYKRTREPLKVYTGEVDKEDPDCAICLVEMKTELTICETCRKVTHLDCQNKWGRTCVYCRTMN